MTPMATDRRTATGFMQPIVALLLFGIAFGYVEAAVVVYLRAIYDPLRHELHPDRPAGELFPLIRADELESLGKIHVQRLITELGREAATLIMLAAVALAIARNRREWLAAFAVAFGVWDIFFYVFLKVLIDWPASLMTWDILFLLPLPWVGPVLSPVLVALTMVVCGTFALWRERAGRPVRLGWKQTSGVFAGAVILVAAFCWDYRNTMAGGWPNPFNWPVYAVGLGLGLLAFIHAVISSRGAQRGEADRRTASERPH
jgi:hypothetical protein